MFRANSEDGHRRLRTPVWSPGRSSAARRPKSFASFAISPTGSPATCARCDLRHSADLAARPAPRAAVSPPPPSASHVAGERRSRSPSRQWTDSLGTTGTLQFTGVPGPDTDFDRLGIVSTDETLKSVEVFTTGGRASTSSSRCSSRRPGYHRQFRNPPLGL